MKTEEILKFVKKMQKVGFIEKTDEAIEKQIKECQSWSQVDFDAMGKAMSSKVNVLYFLSKGRRLFKDKIMGTGIKIYFYIWNYLLIVINFIYIMIFNHLKSLNDQYSTLDSQYNRILNNGEKEYKSGDSLKSKLYQQRFITKFDIKSFIDHPELTTEKKNERPTNTIYDVEADKKIDDAYEKLEKELAVILDTDLAILEQKFTITTDGITSTISNNTVIDDSLRTAVLDIEKELDIKPKKVKKKPSKTKKKPVKKKISR